MGWNDAFSALLPWHVNFRAGDPPAVRRTVAATVGIGGSVYSYNIVPLYPETDISINLVYFIAGPGISAALAGDYLSAFFGHFGLSGWLLALLGSAICFILAAVIFGLVPFIVTLPLYFLFALMYLLSESGIFIFLSTFIVAQLATNLVRRW